MLSDSAVELIAEFDSTKHLRLDVAKPVWHNSLRLPDGETLTNEQWSIIADDYMKRMGFSDTHLRCYVLHDDDGQHIHIIASRIDLNGGKLYLGRNENLISTQIISKKQSPKLIEDLIPGVISLTTLHKVLQNLLSERVPIRDMRTIIDTLAEYATPQSDADELTARVRARLSRAITQQWFPGDDDIQIIGLDMSLEQLLVQATQSGSAIEPGIAENLMKQTEQALQHQEALGAPPVLLVNPALRLMLSRYLRRIFPQLAVLSSQEINTQRNVRMTYLIGGKS
ncbi:FHIPEP family type III secretion protein [Enterobacter hormaechei]|uniref:FHIPEP family type III secretion protein n=1 Tax=Enterobacter hormaechei TaxID=158836 RepID=UPI003F67CD4D